MFSLCWHYQPQCFPCQVRCSSAPFSVFPFYSFFYSDFFKNSIFSSPASSWLSIPLPYVFRSRCEREGWEQHLFTVSLLTLWLRQQQLRGVEDWGSAGWSRVQFPQLSLSLVMEDVRGGQWQPQLSAKRPVVGRQARTSTPTFILPSSICVFLKRESISLAQ